MRQRFGGAGCVEAESRHGEQPAKAEGRRRPAAEAAAAREGARRRPHAAVGDAGRAAAVAPRGFTAGGRHVVAGRGDSLRGQRAGSGGSTDSASRGGNGGPGGEGEGAVESWEGHPVQLSMTLDVRWAWTVGRRWNSLHDGNTAMDWAISGYLHAIYSVGQLPSTWRCDDARCTQHGAQSAVPSSTQTKRCIKTGNEAGFEAKGTAGCAAEASLDRTGCRSLTAARGNPDRQEVLPGQRRRGWRLQGVMLFPALGRGCATCHESAAR
jgi:hypothetical protein